MINWFIQERITIMLLRNAENSAVAGIIFVVKIAQKQEIWCLKRCSNSSSDVEKCMFVCMLTLPPVMCKYSLVSAVDCQWILTPVLMFCPQLGHNGATPESCWLVDQLSVAVPTKGIQYNFLCKCWLAKDRGDGLTTRVFNILDATTIGIIRKVQTLVKGVIWCFFKDHYFVHRLSQTLRFLQSPSFRRAESALIGQLTQHIVIGWTPQAWVGNVP